ncbi:MAG TPA: MmcQ/YjbR family DNA-binding protein [Longimicrobium sp.]|nr:MmcQ/YjbR family DNA-binding protein [Longimicrobium sp.]
MTEAPGDLPGVTFAQLRGLALALPGVEEGTSYGTPAFRVKGKLFLRLWEDGETLVLKTDFHERDHLLATDPETFFVTDHYRGYPIVLVRLPAVRPAHLASLVEDSWRRHAPARVVAAYDQREA